MKNISMTFLFMISFSVTLLAQKEMKQEQDNIDLIKTDSTWGKEVFTFPLRFAKEIKYEGFEEAQFPKGWIKEESPEFWSYAFVWNINLVEELTAKKLEKNLQIYFDGLMLSVNKEKGKTLPSTIAKISKTEDSNGISYFSGIIKIYDSFVTKKPLLLNVRIEKQDCKQNQKSLVLFRFSPKEFDHNVWNTLEKVVLRDNICNLKQ